MELSEIITWSMFQEPELFFNDITGIFFLKHGKDIWYLIENKWEFKFQLENNAEQRLKSACISIDNVFMCYKIIDNEMVSNK